MCMFVYKIFWNAASVATEICAINDHTQFNDFASYLEWFCLEKPVLFSLVCLFLSKHCCIRHSNLFQGYVCNMLFSCSVQCLCHWSSRLINTNNSVPVRVTKPVSGMSWMITANMLQYLSFQHGSARNANITRAMVCVTAACFSAFMCL